MSLPVIPTSVSSEAAAKPRVPEGLREAAEEFESLYMRTLIKQMRDAQLDEGFFGDSAGSSVYEGIFEQFLSEQLASTSPLGIADMLVEGLAGRLDAGPRIDGAIRDLRTLQADRAYRSAALGSGASAASAIPPGVSRSFGWGKDPFTDQRRFHAGVDLPAPTGTPVKSIAPGTVVSVGRNGGYGLEVLVRHGEDWTSRYAHLSGADVTEGQLLARGQMLGRVGSTGRSTGPHLHFEALKGGSRMDPALAAPGPLRPQVLGAPADKSPEVTQLDALTGFGAEEQGVGP